MHLSENLIIDYKYITCIGSKTQNICLIMWNTKQNSDGTMYVLVPLYIHITKNTKHVSAHGASAVACSFFCQG